MKKDNITVISAVKTRIQKLRDMVLGVLLGEHEVLCSNIQPQNWDDPDLVCFQVWGDLQKAGRNVKEWYCVTLIMEKGTRDPSPITQEVQIDEVKYSVWWLPNRKEWWIQEDSGMPYFKGTGANNRRVEPDMAESYVNGNGLLPGLCYDI